MTTNIDRAAGIIREIGQLFTADTIAHNLAEEGLIATTPPKPYLHPVTMWQAKCSECGYIQVDYGDFTAMDAVGVIEQVQYDGWALEDDRLVCDSCQEKETNHEH